MKSPTRSLLAALVAASLSGAADAADLENTLYMDLKDGRVVIEMRPDLAPKHVAQIKRLTRKGFYDGLVFHRVIEGFMVQGGDPDGNGTGGSGNKLPAEFSDEQHLRGVTSMARSRNPDSADSQFFIMLGRSPHLDGSYTVWGKVVSGMDFVDNIKKGDSRRNGTVSNPDKIVRMRVAADVK
jgi:peptidylprolyl isomerase